MKLIISFFSYFFYYFFFFFSSSSSSIYYIEWNMTTTNYSSIITLGDSIIWIWTTSSPMSIQSSSTKYSFQSSSIISKYGYKYKVTFNNIGKYSYRCSVHPYIYGTIIVNPSLDNTITSKPTKSPSISNTIKLTPIIYPSNIASSYSVANNWNTILYVREKRINIGPFSFNTRVFCFRTICSYPGPTLRVKPGDNLTITLINELSSDIEFESDTTLPSHGVNTTNLYFHGVRLSPTKNSYFKQVSPGSSTDILVSIQPNHAPGIHWYRSQNHGFDTLHVMNGLVGAIVVEPETSNTNVAYPTALKNSEMVILVVTKLVIGQELIDGKISQQCGIKNVCASTSQYPLCFGNETSSPFNMYRLDSLEELTKKAGGKFNINLRLNTTYNGPPITQSLDLVNGRYQPKITITQSSPIIFRFVHASAGLPLRLSLTEGASCIMTILAWDGIYMRSRTSVTVLMIPVGGRCEVEVKCTELGSIKLYNQENNNQVLLHITVQALPQGGVLRKNIRDDYLAAIVRPPYLDDVNNTFDQSITINFSQENKNSSKCKYWMGSGTDCSLIRPYGIYLPNLNDTIDKCEFKSFIGPIGTNKWTYVNMNKLITFEGAIVEMTLYGLGTDQLPFHIQSSPFQIISVSSTEEIDNFYAIGSWRDTLPLIAGNVTIRFHAPRQSGEAIFGTSFLPQQDRGILDTFLIVNFSEFQSLTEPPTSAPTVTPDDDQIGPLGTMWIIIIVVGVVVIGGTAAAIVTFFTKDRVYIVPKTEF